MHQELHTTALPPSTMLYNLLFMKINRKKESDSLQYYRHCYCSRLDYSRLIKNVAYCSEY